MAPGFKVWLPTLNVIEPYFLTQGRASAIIQEVLDAIEDWQSAAERLQLPQRDIRRFEERFICA